ncbi:MAG: hypothetical protein Kow0031_23310 [Anaerolineae bacterium]
MNTLRTRLILSHILPLVIVLPLVGVALVYLLETQVFLQSLADELQAQAALTAAIAASQPEALQNSAQAQIFITRFSAANRAEINLLDSQGRLLASSNPTDSDRVGVPLDTPNLATALAGGNTVQISNSFSVQAQRVEVLVPVVTARQEVLGVVRLSHRLQSMGDRSTRLRSFTAWVMVAALVGAVAVALLLALNLERSLRRVADAIGGITQGQQWRPLPESGPREMRQLARAFNTLLEQLRELEDSRQRLLANIVHEVARPIGAVQAAIQALLAGADEQPELRHELLEGMESEVERLHPLLDNLAKLHETVLGPLELKRRPVSLSEWLPPTVVAWREAAHAKGLHWQMELPESLPVLSLDPDRLGQVLGNLLSNAVKYTPPGGTVSVAAGQTGAQVWIRVGDTGPGIAPEEQAKVFEPLFRSQREKRFPQGMGLGLTIARDIVAAHGGRIGLDSRPGQGSRFTVWLPSESSP